MTSQVGLKIYQRTLNAPTDLAALTNPDGERSSGVTPVWREGDEDEEDGEIPEESRHICSRQSLSHRGAHLLSVLEEIRWVPNNDCCSCQTVRVPVCPHSVREKSRVKHRIVSHRLIAIETETDGQTEGRTEADGTLARASALPPSHSFRAVRACPRPIQRRVRSARRLRRPRRRSPLRFMLHGLWTWRLVIILVLVSE